MNTSLFRSLTGGRLAIVDFPPDTPDSAPAGRRDRDDAHGVTPATVIEELAAPGFVGVQKGEWTLRPHFLVVAKRP